MTYNVFGRTLNLAQSNPDNPTVIFCSCELTVWSDLPCAVYDKKLFVEHV